MLDWVSAAALGLLLAAEMLLLAPVTYLVWLSLLALGAPRESPGSGEPPQHRFAVMIPAHDEARLLPDLLESLRALDYPPSLLHVYVVADNCSDNTAALARSGGARVYERNDATRTGKGYALQWLWQQVLAAEGNDADAFDAFVFLDADTIVSPNFLQVMDARLRQGERVIQAYYAVREPERSWAAGLRYVALAALHYLRPAGRTRFGGSAGLKGNGMVFAAPVLRQHAWSASITEDIEQHMALLLSGERVSFAPDAVVRAEMPDSLAQAESQNVRWEQGRLEMARRYVPRLLKAALRAPARAPVLLDAVAEHLIPPFSVLAVVSAVVSFLAWVWPSAHRRRKWARLLSVPLLLGQVLYVGVALRLVRAPWSIVRALLYAPAFAAWKVGVYARLWLGRRTQRWVRTSRDR